MKKQRKKIKAAAKLRGTFNDVAVKPDGIVASAQAVEGLKRLGNLLAEVYGQPEIKIMD